MKEVLGFNWIGRGDVEMEYGVYKYLICLMLFEDYFSEWSK